MPLEFIYQGRTVEADELKAGKPTARKTVKRDDSAGWHKGFVVEGFKPGHMAELERLHNDERARWAAMSDEQKQAEYKEGRREPGRWDEDAMLRKMKRHRLSKVYSTPEAAQEFAALAERHGFTHVEWRALQKAARTA